MDVCGFETSLVYTGNFRTARTIIVKILSKHKNKNKQDKTKEEKHQQQQKLNPTEFWLKWALQTLRECMQRRGYSVKNKLQTPSARFIFLLGIGKVGFTSKLSATVTNI